MSCPDLSLNGLEHQENTSVQPLSANHGNDPNQWPTEVTQLSQEQTVPETEYEKVKGGGGVTEAKDGEGERQIDMGDEEMQTDMVCMAETDTPEILRVCPRENQAKPGKTRQEVIQLKSTILWLAIRFKITTGYTRVFLLRILVYIRYVWALSSYIRPFRSRIYAFLKGHTFA